MTTEAKFTIGNNCWAAATALTAALVVIVIVHGQRDLPKRTWFLTRRAAPRS